jgi:hypothetical protein
MTPMARQANETAAQCSMVPIDEITLDRKP